jgi:hypothetical protein
MINFLKQRFCKDKSAVTYSYIKDTFGSYYPKIPIKIFSNSEVLDLEVLVDSGADITLIPKTLGETLNLKRTNLRYIGGVGGRMGYYLNDLKVEIAGKKVTIPVAWSTQDTVPILLGRAGVFEKFKFCFDDKNKIISVILL